MARKSLHFFINKFSYKSLLSILFILLIAVVVLARFIFPNQKVSAAWWNEGWGYRKAIPITNTSGSILTNQRVKVIIDTSALITVGKLQSSCNDLRFTDIHGNVLDHWSTGCNTTTTNIYIKIPTISTTGTTIYLYYSNPSALKIEKPLGTTDTPGTSCQMMKDQGSVVTNGLSYIVPGGADLDKQLVYCDQTTDGGGWAQVMNQNVTTGGYFANIAEAQIFNEANPNAGRYSILGKLAKFKDNGIFTFKINWSVDGTRNIWSQTSDPTQDVDVAGYTPINIGTSVNGWGGLEYGNGTHAPANGGSAFIDGTVNTSTWYYAVASYVAWSGGIPAYSPMSLQTQLWVKGNNTMNNVSVGSLATEELSPAPIAHWKFDEGNGTTFHDSTSNQNDGSFNTGTTLPTWQEESQCISGKCLNFSSTASTSIPNFNYNILKQGQESASWTMSIWVNPISQKKSDRVIIGRSGCISGLIGNMDSFKFTIRTASCLTNAKEITYAIPDLKKWYFLTAVYNNRNMSFYVNSKLVGSDTFTDTIAMHDDILYIGGLNELANYYGSLDEPKIYTYARTLTQIKSDYAAGLAHTSSNKGTSANLGTNNQSADFLSNGLVGYWKMDEGIGATAFDSSGNNKNGNFGIGDSAPIWSTGKFGVGLSFDGSNDYVNFGDPGLSSLTTTTISFWRKAANTNAWLLFQGQDGNYYVMATSGSGSFYHNNIGSAAKTIYIDGKVATAPLTDTNWHHYVITGVNLSTWTNLRLSNYPNYQYNGLIDEVRIYNRTLTPSEVSSLYNWAPGPVGYWNFDEKTGTIVNDKGGNNNGTWNGTGSHWTLGKYGSAGNFSNNNYINAGNNPSLNINGPITLESWVKPSVGTGQQGIIGTYGHNSAYSLYLRHSPGADIGFFINQNGVNKYTMAGTVNYGSWNHIASSWDGTNVSVYLNGSLISSSVGSSQLDTRNFQGVYLGYNTTIAAPNFLNGQLDEVKIYNYARTQKQITQDMNAGHPAGGSPVGSQLGYWKFDEGFGSTANNSGNQGSILNATFGTGNSAPTWTNDGKLNKALNFSANQYISYNSYFLENAKEVTISAWVKPVSDTYIFQYGSSGSYNGYINNFRINSNGSMTIDIEYLETGHFTPSTSTNVVPLNTWSYVSVSVGTNYVKFYVNGVLVTTSSYFSGMYPLHNANISYNNIGRYYYNSTTFSYSSGSIDEVKVYNSALTDEEIKIDYNRGASTNFGASNQTIGATTTSLDYCIPGDTSACSAPIAEWKMDEKTGTIINDTSANNNTGTFGTGTSAPTWTPGKIGAGLKFDGSNDKVTTSFNIGTTEFTIETFFKVNSFSDTEMSPISLYDGSASRFLLSINSNAGYKLRPFIGGIALWGVTNLQTGQWYHAVFTRNSSGFTRLYLNGKFESEIQMTTAILPQIGLTLGNGAGRFFNGILDHVKIYNYARTPAQIAYDYNKGEPIGWWKFNECQGNIAQDSSGISNTGTISIGTSGTQTSVGTCTDNLTTSAWNNGKTGKYNSGLNFDGTDDCVNMGDPLNGTLDFGLNDFSTSAWIKTSTSNAGVIIGKYNGYPLFYSRLNADGKIESRIGFDASTNFTSTDGSVVNNSLWHQFVVVYKRNGNMTRYLDGKIYGTQLDISSVSTRTVDTSNLFSTGSANCSGQYFNGQIDDVRVYNYALTSTQIKTLYNNGAVNFSN